MAGKFAILTDIHGNGPALRAVLAELDARSDIAHTYCLGDQVSIGPDLNEVLGLLAERAATTLLRGNHEGYLLDLIHGRDPGLKGEELDHQRWMAARLDRQFIPLLEALPWSAEAEGIRFVHYHLDSAGGYAPVDRAPIGGRLDAHYADAPYRAVCFGHHHPVHQFRTARRLYLNPGALGCCDLPVARYALLDPATLAVQLREVPYDIRAFLASYERLSVPARSFILRAFHGGQQSS